ncbi:GNAT family N-acetyltransferase [Flindersiella endophytica]
MTGSQPSGAELTEQTGIAGLTRLDSSDDQAIAELVRLYNTAEAVDEPWQPGWVPGQLAGAVRHGWDGEPADRWLLREDGSGTLIGELRIHLPMRDNLHRAGIGVLVHPDHRRHGHGRRLLEYGLGLLRESGRRVVGTDTVDAPGPVAFAERLGFTRASVEIQRRQDLGTLDRELVDALYDEAAEAAAGYELLKIVGPTPEHLIDAVAVMTAAINDAPNDDMDVEDHVYDAERIRAFDQAQAGWANRVYRLIARRRSDGALAGHTMVGVHPEQSEWGGQYDTSVLKEHRGHKLGLLLKAAMVRWLDETEPQLLAIDTWNAESNSHMIGINERLGYRIAGRYLGWQKDLS